MVDLFGLEPSTVISLIFICASTVTFTQKHSNKYMQFSTQETKSDSQIDSYCMYLHQF